MAMRVATIGDGAMATVCSQILASKGREVRVWGRDAARLAGFNAGRENTRYLPGVKLVEQLRFEADGRELFAGCEYILCAVPTQHIRGALEKLRGFVPAGVPVISVAKGIEVENWLRPSEVIEQMLGERTVAALAGPCIAGELAKKLPATMVVAVGGEDALIAEMFAKDVQELLRRLICGSTGITICWGWCWRGR